ncbi:hypothetical protein [Streptacidiphilus sp. PB12-B1b]|uniref:hypothetical protein n=1 Tax=Streptacidiphilus sp. PB12-B1b TaxID=2705012 RepID=UPI001CDB85C9|nr:hypothetical protein [Streptacidiphilus sp. PB12-B1b]
MLLVLEALASGLVGAVLGDAVTRQNMSFGGLAPRAMAVGAWVGLGALAVFLLVTAAAVARTALRGRSMGRPTRILLIVCAVLHGVLAAGLLALSGVSAFAVLAVTLTLLVLLLFTPHQPAPGPGQLLAPDAAPTPVP